MDNPIKATQYVVDYSVEDKIPVMVYYMVYADSLGSYGRYNFHSNYSFSGDQKYYSNSGYDKGHMFSSASSHSYNNNYESFDMINILPQSASLNRGLWKQTELFERNNCEPYCYVICGVILNGNEEKLGDITIPNLFYKAIYNPKKKYMIAFLMDQDDKGKVIEYTLTVDKLEFMIEKNLFYQLPVYLQFSKESNVDLSEWDF